MALISFILTMLRWELSCFYLREFEIHMCQIYQLHRKFDGKFEGIGKIDSFMVNSSQNQIWNNPMCDKICANLTLA